MKYSPAELAERLKAEGESVLEFFQALSPGEWSAAVYTDKSAWMVREVLAHFISAERGFQLLFEYVAAGKEGASADFNVDEYNDRTVRELSSLEPDVLLGQYAMTRERTIALVRAMQPLQLEQKGRHPAIGVAPLGDMVRVVYHHNSLHLRDVRRALRAQGSTQVQARLT